MSNKQNDSNGEKSVLPVAPFLNESFCQANDDEDEDLPIHVRELTERLKHSIFVSISSTDSHHPPSHNVNVTGHGSVRPRTLTKHISHQLDEQFQNVYEETPENLKDHTPAVKVSPMNEKYSHREHLFIVFLGSILSFSSGFSNGISLSGLLLTENAEVIGSQSTSGMTGVYTRSALTLASSDEIADYRGNLGKYRFVGFQLTMILAYMVGSCITALLNPRPAPWRVAPMYVPTFLIGAVCMIIAAVLAANEQYTQFEVPYFFHFVAIANGIQNGISSMYSANLIRTTHLTGTTTDIGLLLGQLLRGNTKNRWKLPILTTLAGSFWMGSFLSLYAIQQWREFTLLVNAAIFFIMFIFILLFMVYNLHIPLHRALRGAWHWQRTMRKLEFRSIRGGQPKADEALHAIFGRLDKNCDGYISVDDLYDGLHEMGMTDVTKHDVKSMFLVGDSRRQGRMSIHEFRQLINGENVVVG